MWLLVVSVVGALVISGLCSLMEATLLSLRPGQVAEMADKRPRLGRVWQRLKDNIERPIAAILILNTAAHTIGASVAGAEFDRVFGDEWIWAFSLVFTFLMLQFTEILPKGIGVQYNRAVAGWIGRPLSWLVQATLPIQAVVHFINRPFEPVRSKAHLLRPVDEIAGLTRVARLSGEISREQERIIREGTRLAEIKVRDVMRPRVDIDALDVDTPGDEVLGAIAMSGFSRVPVYERDLDGILGFIYIKDLLLELHMGRPLVLRKLIRPMIMVPEGMRLDQLVDMFRTQRTQMAVVLDEHGGTDGLVTLEDVLEEIVGTIHDEHREEADELVRLGDGRWRASGGLSVDRLLDGVGRPDLRTVAPSNVRTVGGLVQMHLDRVPETGDRATWEAITMVVTAMDGNRIDQVTITVQPR